MSSETARVSSKGQVVLPRAVRDRVGIKEGDLLSVYGDDDLIVLKRVDLPDPEEVERILAWGRRFVKERGLTRSEVDRAVREIRKRTKKGGP